MNAQSRNMLLALVGALSAGIAAASPTDEEQITLKEGTGRDVVTGNCVMCHSLDYIPMNSVFLKKAGWQATVNKMVKAMGAPISQEDVAVIVDYLTKNYGAE